MCSSAASRTARSPLRPGPTSNVTAPAFVEHGVDLLARLSEREARHPIGQGPNIRVAKAIARSPGHCTRERLGIAQLGNQPLQHLPPRKRKAARRCWPRLAGLMDHYQSAT